ncbi:hypothetical protein MUN89_15795 [Halobacillus salinarum]|uniref:Uncharacterized protein n=1 Tax=Halobacillus salinarum TaxID=2932257 RepID=A0ABY4EFX3_9BACI|nr:hypothetical protein [Halobacillus salinarum]UOQ43373.1 hypothetical protein MUN89_15795 [Halobacillus salinarum]
MTTVTGRTLPEVVNRCREIEERGFECISPIKKLYKTKKLYAHESNTRAHLSKDIFVGMDDVVLFKAVYRDKSIPANE